MKSILTSLYIKHSGQDQSSVGKLLHTSLRSKLSCGGLCLNKSACKAHDQVPTQRWLLSACHLVTQLVFAGAKAAADK